MNEHEATERLRQAIIDHATAIGIAEPEIEMLNDFAVVCHWQKVEDDGLGSRYSAHYSSESVPAHTAIGLFTIGLDFAQSKPEDDD